MTVKKGTLAGCYQVKDGQFIEFQERDEPYIIHEKESYDLVVIPKYSYDVQDFGPNKVYTVKDGSCGIFEKEGIIEVKDPGFYKVSCEYKISECISLKIYTELFNNLQFNSKDRINMQVNGNFSWKVTDPIKVAKFPGSFTDIHELITSKIDSTIIRSCQVFNRTELLPTQSDIIISDTIKEEDISTKMKKLYEYLSNECINNMKHIVESAGIGVYIIAIRIDSFTLLDEQIAKDLNEITRSILAKKSAKMAGELAVERAEALKIEAERKTDTDAIVKIKIAEADAQVKETDARSGGRAKIAMAEAENKVKILMETTKAKADLEVEKINAERRATKLEIEIKEKIKTSEAEANAIKLIAEATFEKETKEFEARSKMPSQELELEKAKIAATAVENYGRSDWQYPNQITAFMKEMLPYLRLIPKPASDAFNTLGGHTGNVDKEQTLAYLASFNTDILNSIMDELRSRTINK